ncbi:hypothetical protein KC19_8G148200 [Ceratodon purpureus]|uniref:S1 motif domain-containing protein n=1 Tax=Ceratodon purpureus TaxID=3225 RepID=A0A8T0GYL4_CERPU|nr:hypothetical protein KC19_8G148200 [Ceratodon purpureus]
MSARVCTQQLQGLALCPPRGVRALQAPGGRLFLQQARRFSCGRLTVSPKTRFRLRNTRSLKCNAEYTSSQDRPLDEDVRNEGLDLGLIQDAGLLSKNGYSRSSAVEGSNDGHVSVSSSEVHVRGHVNGHAQKGSSSLEVVAQNGFKGNGQVPTGEPTAEDDGAAAGASDTQAGLDDLEYYVPEIGHRVVGVVVSGNRLKLDVNIGAAKLAHLHVQNLFPLDRILIDESKWVLGEDAGEGKDGSIGVPSNGRPHVLYDEEVFEDESTDTFVEAGTVLEMEVTGKTVSGIALLSARKAAARAAWDRVVQIKDENEPIEVVIIELNTSGLIARVEGLRAFLPLSELLKRPDSSKGETHDVYMGKTLWVNIVFAREIRGNIIISEKDAWIKRNLQLWSLHDGTVIRLFPYGALVHLNDTDIWGMIHISNIASARIGQVSDVFELGEQIKMLSVESPVPDRYSFSTALLESEPGLMLQDKQRVFREAEERAAELRKTLADSKQPTRDDDDDAEKPTPWKITKPISNWEWLEFIKEDASSS